MVFPQRSVQAQKKAPFERSSRRSRVRIAVGGCRSGNRNVRDAVGGVPYKDTLVSTPPVGSQWTWLGVSL